MNAVGIDVSKGKSTVAIYQPGDQEILKPRDSCLKTRECAGCFSTCSISYRKFRKELPIKGRSIGRFMIIGFAKRFR